MGNTQDLLIKNIGVLVTPIGIKALSGKEQGNVKIFTDVYIEITKGLITRIGPQRERGSISEDKDVIDAQGLLVTPGLVDSHTHLVFGGWRQRELSLKLKGISYLDILKMGGGILNSVKATREASVEELVSKGKVSLNRMLAHGTTTCEAKSGYGLDTITELKILKAIKELDKTHLMDIVPTFMGAHALPKEYQGQREEFIKLVVEDMIPKVAQENLAEFCDVFCEEGVFNLEESRYILEKGKEYGLLPKIHADEITPLGGAQLAGQVNAISAEHLIQSTDEGLNSLAKAGTIAVLLPGTSLYLDKPFARARTMIDMGIPVAMATDFNPGSSPNESLQLPMNLACIKYKMTPEEVLTAVTLNGAAAINRADIVGSIEVGKQGDIVIWDSPDLDFIFYHYGTNLVKSVIKKGIPIDIHGDRPFDFQK